MGSINKLVNGYFIVILVTVIQIDYYCAEANTTVTDEMKYSDIEKENLMIFHDLDSVLKVFNSKEHSDLEETRRVIHDFNHVCLGYRHKVPVMSPTRQPFIVIEGNHRTSRKIVARRLARRIGGSFLQNPPNCLVAHRSSFAYGSVLRRAYFGLAIYASAQVASRIANKWPVVLNGYWMDQTSFTISRAFADRDLPPENSKIYQWPYDLLKPDLGFYIHFPDNLHNVTLTTRVPQTWRNKMKKAYDIMKDDTMFEISTEKGFDYVLGEIEDIITQKLSDKYVINFTDRPPRRRNFYI